MKISAEILLTERRTRVARSVVANIYALFVRIFIQLAQVPLFLYFWNVQQYGEWILLSTFPTYFVLSGLGLSTAGANSIAISVARGDLTSVRTVFKATRIVVSLSNIALISLAVLGVTIFDFAAYFDFKTVTAIDIRGSLFAWALLVVLRLQVGIYETSFRAWGGYPEYLFIENSLQLVELAAQVVVLWCGGYFLAVIVSAIIVRIVALIVITIYVRWRVNWLFEPEAGAIWATIQELWLPSLSFLLYPLGLAVQLQGFSMMVGALFGAVGLASFTTLRTLVRVSETLMALVSGTLQPEVSYAAHGKDINLLKRMFLIVSSVAFVSALAIALGLILVGPLVYRIWTHSQLSFSASVFAAFLVVGVLRSISMPATSVLVGMNRHARFTSTYLVSSIASLGVGFVAAELTHSVAAVVVSTALLEIYLLIYCLQAVLPLLHLTIGSYIRHLIDPRVLMNSLADTWKMFQNRRQGRTIG